MQGSGDVNATHAHASRSDCVLSRHLHLVSSCIMLLCICLKAMFVCLGCLSVWEAPLSKQNSPLLAAAKATHRQQLRICNSADLGLIQLHGRHVLKRP